MKNIKLKELLREIIREEVDAALKGNHHKIDEVITEVGDTKLINKDKKDAYTTSLGKRLDRTARTTWANRPNTAATKASNNAFKAQGRKALAQSKGGASDAATAAKAQNLTNLGFGRWGKPGPDGKMKVTNVTDKGKLVPWVPAGEPDSRRPGPLPPEGYADRGPTFHKQKQKTPDDQRAANKPTDSLGPAPGEGGHMSKERSIVAQKIVSKINDKVHDMDLSPHFNQDMPIDDFSKLTGLTPKQIGAYDKYADNYERAFSIGTDPGGTKSVHVYDPQDL